MSFSVFSRSCQFLGHFDDGFALSLVGVRDSCFRCVSNFGVKFSVAFIRHLNGCGNIAGAGPAFTEAVFFDGVRVGLAGVGFIICDRSERRCACRCQFYCLRLRKCPAFSRKCQRQLLPFRPFCSFQCLGHFQNSFTLSFIGVRDGVVVGINGISSGNGAVTVIGQGHRHRDGTGIRHTARQSCGLFDGVGERNLIGVITIFVDHVGLRVFDLLKRHRLIGIDGLFVDHIALGILEREGIGLTRLPFAAFKLLDCLKLNFTFCLVGVGDGIIVIAVSNLGRKRTVAFVSDLNCDSDIIGLADTARKCGCLGDCVSVFLARICLRIGNRCKLSFQIALGDSLRLDNLAVGTCEREGILLTLEPVAPGQHLVDFDFSRTISLVGVGDGLIFRSIRYFRIQFSVTSIRHRNFCSHISGTSPTVAEAVFGNGVRVGFANVSLGIRNRIEGCRTNCCQLSRVGLGESSALAGKRERQSLARGPCSAHKRLGHFKFNFTRCRIGIRESSLTCFILDDHTGVIFRSRRKGSICRLGDFVIRAFGEKVDRNRFAVLQLERAGFRDGTCICGIRGFTGRSRGIARRSNGISILRTGQLFFLGVIFVKLEGELKCLIGIRRRAFNSLCDFEGAKCVLVDYCCVTCGITLNGGVFTVGVSNRIRNAFPFFIFRPICNLVFSFDILITFGYILLCFNNGI